MFTRKNRLVIQSYQHFKELLSVLSNQSAPSGDSDIWRTWRLVALIFISINFFTCQVRFKSHCLLQSSLKCSVRRIKFIRV